MSCRRDFAVTSVIPREGGYLVHRSFSIMPQVLSNTGSSAFADDDSQNDRRSNPVLNFVCGAFVAMIAFNGGTYRRHPSASHDRYQHRYPRRFRTPVAA